MDADQAPQSFKLDIAPRRLSLTQRLVGQSKEWMQNYYVSQEKDDQMYGHGFNDVVDDFVPGVLYNNAQRRRTMSVGSEGDESVTSPNRSRTNSISERVAGMQVISELPRSQYPTHQAPKRRQRLDSLGDISDMSILY